MVSASAVAAPSAAERETARKFMDEGVARMKDKDPKGALENFQKAHELMHVPTTGVAVAKAQLALGHLVEAREAAVDVVRTQKESGEPAVFEKARKQAREIEGQIKGKIPTIRIHVRGPSPTTVAVDGNEIPISLLSDPVPVNPGKRVITAKSADGSEGRTEIEMREGDKSDADVTLKPKGNDSETKPADKPSSSSSSSSSSSPAAPTEKPKVLGFGNEDRAGGGPKRTPLSEGLIFGGFGLGAAGVGVGAVTGLMTLNRASDIKQSCANNVCGPAAKKDLDSANTLGAISTIAIGVGIAGIAAGILGLAMPPKNASAGVQLHPTANGIGGTF